LPKFPKPPGVAALRDIPPQTLILAVGTILARIYFSAGPHPLRWNEFRSFGPTSARWDHHLPERVDTAQRSRSVFYCAPDVDTCAAEVFQNTRWINRTRNSPTLVLLALRRPVTLLDLRGPFATVLGASTAIHSGSRPRARAWARELYEAFPDVEGLYYGSSMNGHAPAIVLNDRAQQAMPAHPEFRRSLNDDIVVPLLQRIAQNLSYGLR
jgi:hypothetical protein